MPFDWPPETLFANGLHLIRFYPRSPFQDVISVCPKRIAWKPILTGQGRIKGSQGPSGVGYIDPRMKHPGMILKD